MRAQIKLLVLRGFAFLGKIVGEKCAQLRLGMVPGAKTATHSFELSSRSGFPKRQTCPLPPFQEQNGYQSMSSIQPKRKEQET